MKNQTSLKLCPLCGSPAIENHSVGTTSTFVQYEPSRPSTSFIGCGDCGVGFGQRNTNHDYVKSRHNENIELWNKRIAE